MMVFDALSQTPPADLPWGINLGGGQNSVALVIECEHRGHRPDWILFSDTGSERPETYRAVEQLGAWCAERTFTPVTTVRWIRKDGTFEALHDWCLRRNWLPSKAYGYAGCSDKWKIQPMEKWRKQNGYLPGVYAVGFDAGEKKRVEKRVASSKCDMSAIDHEGIDEWPWYPLYAWNLTRQDCKAICCKNGFGWVPKSACFMCPNAKDWEWDKLRREHPDLFGLALRIEANAKENGGAEKMGLRRSKGYLCNLNQGEIPLEDDDEESVCACMGL